MSGEIRSGDVRSGFTPNLVVGVGVTALGILLTLDRLGLADALVWLRYWPLLLTLFGLSIAYQALRGDRADRTPPILPAPLVILLIVVGVVATRASGPRSTSSTDPDRTVSIHAVMSGNQHVVTLDRFQRGEITTVLGESKLDLRQTVIAPGEDAVVDVVTVLGSTIVYVPAGWDVNFDAVPVMGGIKDERRPSPGADDGNDGTSAAVATPDAAGPRPRLVLRGFVMMGGLVIRS